MATTVTPPGQDFGQSLLTGGLAIGDTVAKGIFAQQAAKTASKGIASNTTLILALAGGGGLIFLVLILAVMFRRK